MRECENRVNENTQCSLHLAAATRPDARSVPTATRSSMWSCVAIWPGSIWGTTVEIGQPHRIDVRWLGLARLALGSVSDGLRGFHGGDPLIATFSKG